MKLLLVEDDPIARLAARVALEHAGYVVTRALDGAEALAVLKSSPPFDAIVLDIGTPRMSGLEMLFEAKRVMPLPPVVVVTGHPPSMCLGLKGVTAVLTKPVDAATLVGTIKLLVESRVAHPPKED